MTLPSFEELDRLSRKQDKRDASQTVASLSAVCNVCKIEKPTAQFHKDNSKPWRNFCANKCKACRKVYNQKHYIQLLGYHR